MAQFQDVQNIQIVSNDVETKRFSKSTINNLNKVALHLKISEASELLTISCSTIGIAENIADLIDGYCRLVNNSETSIWLKKGIFIIKLKFKLDLLLLLINCYQIYASS